jgi:hypothetical protein
VATGRTLGDAQESGSLLQKDSESVHTFLLKALLIEGVLLLLIGMPLIVLLTDISARPRWIVWLLFVYSTVIGLYVFFALRRFRTIEQNLEQYQLTTRSTGWGEAVERDPINELYIELRRLNERSAVDPSVNPEIQNRLAQLRALQEEEAQKIRRRLDASLHLKPGTGYQALEEARKLLAEHAHSATKDLPSSR